MPTDMLQALKRAEPHLDQEPFVILCETDANDVSLTLAVTARLRRKCKKARVWKSHRMLSVLENAKYGFSLDRARSRGGSDGLFLLDRDFTPPNTMMRKIFDQFMDKPGSAFAQLARAIPHETAFGVRLVGHHLRLLGVLFRAPSGDTLVLVDVDANK